MSPTVRRLCGRLSLTAVSLLVEGVAAQPAPLLAEMTLREKVGQMTQLTLTPLAVGPLQGRGRVALDPAKLREAVVFAGWPGTEGAEALAEVLFGEVNPSGRLAFVSRDGRRVDEPGAWTSPARGRARRVDEPGAWTSPARGRTRRVHRGGGRPGGHRHRPGPLFECGRPVAAAPPPDARRLNP